MTTPIHRFGSHRVIAARQGIPLGWDFSRDDIASVLSDWQWYIVQNRPGFLIGLDQQLIDRLDHAGSLPPSGTFLWFGGLFFAMMSLLSCGLVMPVNMGSSDFSGLSRPARDVENGDIQPYPYPTAEPIAKLKVL